MRAKTIAIPHVYAERAVYQTMYGSTPSTKIGEAHAFSHIIAEREWRPRSILEMFSGDNSGHRDLFNDVYPWREELESYWTQDAFADIGVANVLREAADVPKSRQFDTVLAHFNSASCVFDPRTSDWSVTADYYHRVYRQIYDCLTDHGVFVLDFMPNGPAEMINTVLRPEGKYTEFREYVGHRSPVRDLLYQHLDLVPKLTDRVEVYAQYETVYDRIDGNIKDHYRAFKIMVNEELVLRIKIERPFCQRLFSEAEIVGQLRHAGFEEFEFWSCDYLNHQWEELDSSLSTKSVTRDSTPAEVTPNVIVAIKP